MPIRDTTQLQQPVPGSSPLPGRIPLLPEDTLKRFPSLVTFNDELNKWWRKTREILRRSNDDIVYPLNQVETDTRNLRVAQGDLLAEIRRVDIARIDGDEILTQTIETIVASGIGVNTYVQSDPPTGAGVGDLWFDLNDGFKMYRWDGTAWIPVDDARISGALAAITVEHTAWVTADSALASSITGVIARLDTGDIATALSSLFASVGPGGALATAITSISARLDTGDIASAISSLQSEVTALGALSTAITSISARLDTGDIATALSTLTAFAGPGGTLASDVTTLTARLNTGDIATAISTLTASAGPTGTLTSAVTALTARLNTGDIATAISSLTASVGPSGALASSITALSARLDTGDIATAIDQLQIDVGPTGTLAAQIASLAASSGNRIYRQASAPSGPNSGDYWVDSDDGNKAYIWNGTAWISVRESDLTATMATVSTINSSYATQTYAEAKRDEAIAAAVASSNGYTDGQITSLASVYATPTSVTSSVSSAISASLASTAGGTIGGAIAGLSSVYATPASVTSTVNSAITASLASTAGGTIGGAINALSSVYATPASVTSTVNSAITASLGSTSGGTIGGAIAALSSVYATPASVTSSISTSISASISGGSIGTAISSAVTTESSARATADGFLEGKYTFRVTTGNVVTGMNITSSTGAGTDTSEVTFQALVFKIHNGSANITPFKVESGSVYIEDAIIKNASITGAKIVDATITAAKIGSVAAEVIQAGTINVSVALTAAKISTSLLGGNVQIYHPADDTRLFSTTSHVYADIIPTEIGGLSRMMYVGQYSETDVNYGSQGWGLGRVVTSDNLIFEGWLRGSTGFSSRRFGHASLRMDVAVSGWGYWQNSSRADLPVTACYRRRDNGGAWGAWTVLPFWTAAVASNPAAATAAGFSLTAPVNGVTVAGTESIQVGLYWELNGTGYPPQPEMYCPDPELDGEGNPTGGCNVPEEPTGDYSAGSGARFQLNWLTVSARIFSF